MLGFGGLQLGVSAGCKTLGAFTVMDVYSDSIILVLKETAQEDYYGTAMMTGT